MVDFESELTELASHEWKYDEHKLKHLVDHVYIQKLRVKFNAPYMYSDHKFEGN